MTGALALARAMQIKTGRTGDVCRMELAMKSKIIPILLALATGGGSAAAQPWSNPYDRDRDRDRDQPPPVVDRGERGDRYDRMGDLLTTGVANNRRGTMTFSMNGAGRYDRLTLVSTDPDLDIVQVDLQYRRGRVERIQPDRDRRLSIDDTRGLQRIVVHYSNRAARGWNYRDERGDRRDRDRRDARIELFGLR